MPLSHPSLSLQTSPAMFSPIYGPNYWTFQANFTNTTADPLTAKVYADIEILNQRYGPSTPTVLVNVGRFKVPNRPNNIFALNVEKQLQPFVTYPHDVATYSTYDTTGGASFIVNETNFMPTITSGAFPRLAPEPEGIVEYRLKYGLEYNPRVSFQQMASSGSSSVYLSSGVNMFCVAGDVITILPDSGLYQYWNGTASVLSIFNDGFSTFIQTDQIPDTTLIASSGGYITGAISSVSHYVSTTNGYNFAYNGVRQYQHNGVDFDNIYYLTGAFERSFLTDWGYDKDHAIPIMPLQSERARFLVNFADATDFRLTARLITYDLNLNTLGTYDALLTTTCSIAGVSQPFNYTCFTLQTFDPAGTITITHSYYYKYELWSGVISGGSGLLLAELWYKGLNPCSKYQNFRIKFLNRQGSWAYWNFYRDQKQTSEITRTEYTRPLSYDHTIDIGYPTSTNNYSLSKQRGTAILSTDVQETFTLNSDWLTEDEYVYLQQLVTSPEVYVFYDAYRQIDGRVLKAVNLPIIITDTSYSFKTRNRESIFNLTINLKYAYSTKIQNR